jgi:hypothetical protein
MTPHGFDAFMRRLTTTFRRRQAVALIAGGLAAMGAMPGGALGCVKVGGPCVGNTDCCAGSRCHKTRRRCVCATGRTQCGGYCYDLQFDEHRGACDVACVPLRERCYKGTCRPLT